jgi:hypothetical protein
MQGSSSMSVAAEPVAGRQRFRERLRAVTLETTLAVSGLVAIAVHVLDDNFFQPQPQTSPLGHRVSGLAPARRRFRSRSAILPQAAGHEGGPAGDPMLTVR